jgi:hypothetical protein
MAKAQPIVEASPGETDAQTVLRFYQNYIKLRNEAQRNEFLKKLSQPLRDAIQALVQKIRGGANVQLSYPTTPTHVENPANDLHFNSQGYSSNPDLRTDGRVFGEHMSAAEMEELTYGKSFGMDDVFAVNEKQHAEYREIAGFKRAWTDPRRASEVLRRTLPFLILGARWTHLTHQLTYAPQSKMATQEWLRPVTKSEPFSHLTHLRRDHARPGWPARLHGSPCDRHLEAQGDRPPSPQTADRTSPAQGHRPRHHRRSQAVLEGDRALLTTSLMLCVQGCTST